MNIEQFRNTLPTGKIQNDSLWVRYVIRNISFYIAYLFQLLGFTANGVTYLSILVVFFAFILFLIEGRFFTISAAVLTQIWLVLDCVDGNLARSSKTKNPYGDAIDAMSGYTFYGFVFLGIGAAAARESGWISQYAPESFFVLIGGIAGASTLVSRIIFQKFLTTGYESRITSTPKSNGFGKNIYLLDKNIGISGFFLPLILLAAIFGFIQEMVVFYSLYYFTVLIFVYARFILKTSTSFDRV
jgi:phosphatidylglycerophosphate synthase